MALPVEMLLGATTLTGLVAMFSQRLRQWFGRVTSLLYVTVNCDEDVAHAVSAYIWHHYRRSPLGTFSFSGSREFVRPHNRVESVAYEVLNRQALVFWHRWRPISVSPRPFVKDEQMASGYRITVSFVRGLWQPEQLVSDSIAWYNQRISGIYTDGQLPRFMVVHHVGRRHFHGEQTFYTSQNDKPLAASTEFEQMRTSQLRAGSLRLVHWKVQDLGPPLSVSKNALDALAFPPDISELIEEVRRWKSSEQWYRERQIPWRRVWSLYGPPGTGKTSLVRAMGQDLDMPVHVFDLADMDNAYFRAQWQESQRDVPAIFLIEDIDDVFHGRVNITGEKGGGLTFDCLLNCISGIDVCSGVFLVITTNHVDQIDPALGCPLEDGISSTRPGRIDRFIELREFDEEARRKVADRIMDGCPELIEDVVEAGSGDTGSQFTERCRAIALARFWGQKADQHSLVQGSS